MSSTNEIRIKEIAERIRALVTGPYGDRLSDAAVALGIGELELSALLQGRVPAVSTDWLVAVLTRVVRQFGVDPSWLVTGRYDARTHLVAEEHRADLISLRFQMNRLLSGPDRPVEIEPIKRADRIPAADAHSFERTEGAAYVAKPESAHGRRGEGGEHDR